LKEIVTYLKLLWLNWRDLKNPSAGGAEVFTHEIARRLARKGHDVTLFSASFAGGLPEEWIDGLRICRKGGRFSVYKEAEKFYKKEGRYNELVIDEINTRPFFVPKYVKNKPVLAVIHQLAREFWFYETRFPISWIGYHFLENRWLSLYRNIPTVTVSNSSLQDLQQLSFKKIYIIPEGINIVPLSELSEKEAEPTIIFVGRLKRVKLPNHALEAFKLINLELPSSKMWIIGDGYMKTLLQEYQLPNVTFFGYLNDEVKYNLLRRAHIMLVPAIREGWGLVVTEANAVGVPAIGYNVHGIRDSIKNGVTGLLTSQNSPAELARLSVNLLRNREQLNYISNRALEDSRKFSWDKSADEFEKVALNTVSCFGDETRF
jgi:glycosyltransferase involved in cell wall biosynthesis